MPRFGKSETNSKGVVADLDFPQRTAEPQETGTYPKATVTPDDHPEKQRIRPHRKLKIVKEEKNAGDVTGLASHVGKENTRLWELTMAGQ